MAKLDRYRARRDFSKTAEPAGGERPQAAGAGGIFVVHKHAARRLHYDLRLEHDGVLWSFAVTRGPSLDPDDRRLAVHVEDHPLEYAAFEGNIPEGEYGAGAVIVWDEGRWTPEGDAARGMASGHLAFTLDGRKLKGRWRLVRLKPRKGEKADNWLLIKVDDAQANRDVDILAEAPKSVVSGRTVEEVAAGKKAPAAKSTARAAKPPAKRGAALAAPPAFVPPQLATLEEHPPAGDDWLHEVKFDGYRVEARVADGEVRLLTRTGLDWTKKFGAGLAAAFAALPCESALIDGEVAALGDNDVSSFPALQAALSDGRTEALVYFAFDLLFLDGQDLRGEPLLARKERLEHLLEGQPQDARLRYSEHFVAAGETMLRHACRMGLEGVVSKRADAPYVSGRSRGWIKSKCAQRQEFVIAGYVPSTAAGRGLRSILAAWREDGELKPAGRVGTGFTAKSAADLKARLDRLRTAQSPFAGAAGREKGIVWVRPELVAEVEFRAWTASKTLRHAAYLGLREDKPAEEVVAEMPAADAPPPAKKAAARRKPAAATALKLGNPGKALWPDVGFTKQNLLDYYATVWPRMAPFVTERPLALLRAPDGVGRQTFFQKHGSPGLSPAIGRMKDADGEEILFIRDFDGLAALVQMGVLEIHVWGSAIAAIETPDQVIFDLDPDPGVEASAVRAAAAETRARLKDLGFESFLKTSGGKGFHVVLPLKPQAGWERVKTFARDFARAMEQAAPDRYTAILSKKARRGRIFIDYLRNGRGATAIAPYSTRARPGAAVAMPIEWSALDKGVAPNAFTAPAVLREGLPKRDPWPSPLPATRGL